MRVFLGFGYLPKESWIADLVLPMLTSLGIEVIDGREIPGTPIDQRLRDLIASCDALIGILTRRKKRRDGQYDTSDYVRQELEIALGAGRPVVPVVEEGVVPPAGFLRANQYVPFTSKTRDRMLVDLGRHVREWITGEVTIRILPDALADALAADAFSGQAQCHYRIHHQGHAVRDGKAEVFGDGGGMFTKLLGFSPGTQAQLHIRAGGADWYSSLTNHTAPFTQIELRRR